MANTAFFVELNVSLQIHLDFIEFGFFSLVFLQTLFLNVSKRKNFKLWK